MKTQIAKLNYLKISPRKVRLVTNLIKGLPVSEAEAQLALNPKRPAEAVIKLLRSAIANAKNNQKLEINKLFIKEIRVNEGPVTKRFMPRAMGRATPINKRSAHIILVLGELEKAKEARFKIVKREKVSKDKAQKITKEKEKESHRHEHKEGKSEKSDKGPGFIKRMFRRKAI